MRRRKLLIALAAAAMFGVARRCPHPPELHASPSRCSAAQTLTVTVDVPPGRRVELDPDPRPARALQSITDLGPVADRDARRRPPTADPTPAAPAHRARRPTPEPRPRTAPATPARRRRRRRRRRRSSRRRGSGERRKRDHVVGDDGARRRTPRRCSGEARAAGKRAKKRVDRVEPDAQHRRLADARQPDRLARDCRAPAPIGVPNFFIDKFRIPPFLLPIYQAAGIEYGVRWEVLAAINEIETDYGRNLNVSSAGALGWMQFMPATWETYGVDANQDGLKDPYNPVDAIFAAARYLRAAGADTDLRARDLRLQPRRLVRRLGHPARARTSAACPPTSSAR